MERRTKKEAAIRWEAESKEMKRGLKQRKKANKIKEGDIEESKKGLKGGNKKINRLKQNLRKGISKYMDGLWRRKKQECIAMTKEKKE